MMMMMILLVWQPIGWISWTILHQWCARHCLQDNICIFKIVTCNCIFKTLRQSGKDRSQFLTRRSRISDSVSGLMLPPVSESDWLYVTVSNPCCHLQVLSAYLWCVDCAIQPIIDNLTSSTKPEVRNILQRRQERTEKLWLTTKNAL